MIVVTVVMMVVVAAVVVQLAVQGLIDVIRDVQTILKTFISPNINTSYKRQNIRPKEIYLRLLRTKSLIKIVQLFLVGLKSKDNCLAMVTKFYNQLEI